MTAYYNEFDPSAAAWLRELIKAGLIAPARMVTLIPALAANSSFYRVAYGMLGRAPIPSPATACYPRIDVLRSVHALADVQSPLREIRRKLRNYVAHLDSNDKNVGFASLPVAFLSFSRDKLLTLKADVHENFSLISHCWHVGICLSITTYSLDLFAVETIRHRCGSYDRHSFFRWDAFSANALCILVSNIFCVYAILAFRFHIRRI